MATSPGIWPDYHKQIKDPRIIKKGFKIRHLSSGKTIECFAITVFGKGQSNPLLNHYCNVIFRIHGTQNSSMSCMFMIQIIICTVLNIAFPVQ
jgi:hypothetical protein